MNDRQTDPATATAAAPPAQATGWTLFNFLDVADLLYERVGAALAEVGLSYPKYEVLEHLRTSQSCVSLGTLAEGQKCARSNITQMVDRLEAEGLVQRVPDPADRRCILAQLTPQGESMALKGAQQMEKLRIEFAATLGDQCGQLDRMLSRLR
jgi:DNA-binding MarR family transcriptional regulator